MSKENLFNYVEKYIIQIFPILERLWNNEYESDQESNNDSEYNEEDSEYDEKDSEYNEEDSEYNEEDSEYDEKD